MGQTATIETLFLDEIRDLYDGEKQLTRALPKMAKAALSEDLRHAFDTHIAQTDDHIERLERVFELLQELPAGPKCMPMAALISEGEDLLKQCDASAVRDVGIIAAAQKVEHLEISGYGSARAYAEMLGHTEAASLLDITLREEKAADETLGELADCMIDDDAAQVCSRFTPNAGRLVSLATLDLPAPKI